MNKFIYLSAAALAAVGLAACSNDDMPGEPASGDGNVNITLKLPDNLTRSFGDGLTATDLTYAVYPAGSTTPIITNTVSNAFSNLNATLSLQLVNGESYDIVFWASNAAAPYTFDATTQSVTLSYGTTLSINDEKRDAFFNHVSLNVSGTINQTVVLKRPFAQINLGTTDLGTAAVGNLKELKTSLSTKAYTGLNLLTGDVTGEQSVTFGAGVPPTDETFPVTDPAGIEYLSMDYILVASDRATVDASFGIYDGTKLLNTVSVPNMPVQRNYRTNVWGQILTSNATLTITIDPIFDGEYDMEVPAWDGTSTEAPKQTDDNTYELSKPEHLAYVAQQVNNGTEDYSGKTLVLTADIDLANRTWTPIGTESKSFKGTLDGQGHKVKNLYVTGNDTTPYIGLFGVTTGTSISNIEIENAHITNTCVSSDSGTGAVAGDPYTTNYSNITLSGEIQITAYRYVGAAFGHNVYGNLTDITVNASGDSYVKATNDYWGALAAPNHAGGVAGYVGEGNTVLSNVKSNIDVISNAPGVGGIVGTIQSGNTFTNCSSSGNVTLRTNEYKGALPALAIGGIAGEHVGSATFKDCTFTGTLASYLSNTLYTLPKVNQTCGIQYGGRTAGLSNSYTGVTINGAAVASSDMATL